MSYSADTRQNAWEHGRRGYFATWARILFDPRGYFASMAAHSLPQEARRFFLRSTILSAVLLPLVILSADYVSIGGLHFRPRVLMPELWDVIYVVTVLAGLWLIIVPAGSMMVAGVISSVCLRAKDRLGSLGAFKIACYASALAVPASIVLGLLIFGDFYYGYRNRRAFVISDEARIMVWAIGAVLLVAWYWVILSRAYEKCRWANR